MMISMKISENLRVYPNELFRGENQGITQEEEKTAKVVLEKLEEKQAMKSKIHILISG